MARRTAKHAEAEHEDGERWLLSFADMMTLLMALFLVLWAMSTTDEKKLKLLKVSLQEAFSGQILPGGKGVQENGGPESSTKGVAPAMSETVKPIASRPATGGARKSRSQEEEAFKKVKQSLDRYAQKAGISGRVKTKLTPEGLQIRLLTDKLLFDSGSAVTKPQGAPLLAKVGQMLDARGDDHPITIVGHTDNQPITSPLYQTNWELSQARAMSVFRAFASAGVDVQRMTPAGRAQLDPITSNDSEAGRDINRRVEILLPHLATEGRTP